MLRPRSGPFRVLALRRAALLCACASLLALPACDDERPASDRQQMSERVGDVLPLVTVAEDSLPRDRDAMLRALAPLPSEALLVVYEIEGPGGINGSLEVLARPGGYRRENWTIEVPLGSEANRRLSGSTVQNPDGVWIEGSEPSTFSPSPLGALAEAALALGEEERRAVVEQLQARRTALAEAREQEQAEPIQILDVPCHVTRVATIEMCLWEATGLPLRYVSDALELRAVNIDTDASIGEHAFELPFDAPNEMPGFDAEGALQQLAKGDLAGLSPYLHPGLRVPTS